MNKDKPTPIKHVKEAQSISIIGSLGFEILDMFGLILHIVAFVLGLLSLIDITLYAAAHESIEIVTLVVVGLIVIFHFVEPILKRVFLHNNFYELWGRSIIKHTFNLVEGIEVRNDYNVKIKDSKVISQEEDIFLGWYRPHWYSRRKLIIQIYSLDTKELIISILFRTVTIDNEYKTIQLQGGMTFPNEPEVLTRETTVTFKLAGHGKRIKRIATWYGNYPEYPLYGSFTWMEK